MVRRLFLLSYLSCMPCWAIAGDKVATEFDRPAVADFNLCAKPHWPMESVRNEQTGVVTFVFLINENGEVADAFVKKSSGHAALDQATLEAVRKCRFKPGIKDGKPVSAWMSMQYVWRLD